MMRIGRLYMSKDKHIAVIGTGYVGLVAACCLAKSGHRVVAAEKNSDKLKQLQGGVMPIYEEGLSDIFTAVTGDGRLTFTSDLKTALAHATVLIIAVGTPSLADGRVDLAQVNAVAVAIARLAEKPLTVIMKSTVPPGTGKSIFKRYFSQAKVPIQYVSNPEFLREGKAVWDWYHPDRLVIGCAAPEVADQLIELYSDIEAPKVTMDITSAEMVKYASNAFLATKISFINEIANLCERVGASIDAVAPAVGMDKRIGPHFLQAGLGYGGSCFPKDTKGLEHVSVFNDYNFNLLKAVIEVNARQRVTAVRKIIKALDGVTGKKIAILGLAFKPGTDDVREAPALDIIDYLISEGAKIAACDPLALVSAKQRFPTEDIQFYTDPYQACRDCAAVVLATEWPEFVNLDWEQIKQGMQMPCMLLDGRNVLDKDVIKRYGYRYEAFGRN
ncbi:MAG: UDP-glucose/GDP-mannose dehydrogenase family protein [Desulfotomaculum sp.]|nr:UDP-glucose/GDP-mannose dehydrogenase family protein [Desulfotomaculum sp.]MCL0081180.1 UDP-glucose/GDP-mannose dehydrogenase family protein [Peptococcaceae bacterium]